MSTSGSRDSARRECTCPVAVSEPAPWCEAQEHPPVSPLPAEGETERADWAEGIDEATLNRERVTVLTAELQAANAEIERLDSWAGLMELLDRRWPADIFPPGETVPTHPTRDAGVRIVALMRWIDRLSASAAAGEVRVEWGVRWMDDVIPDDEPVETWQPTEAMRGEFIEWLHRVSSYRVVAYSTRTVTTSPWVPVSEVDS